MEKIDRRRVKDVGYQEAEYTPITRGSCTVDG
jgi:hypothetical protein